jgi:predicted nicotinamide N-methyase
VRAGDGRCLSSRSCHGKHPATGLEYDAGCGAIHLRIGRCAMSERHDSSNPEADSRDPVDFVKANLRLAPYPTLPTIRLYAAHPGSGLWRLAAPGEDPTPPYWAYPWAGGGALARYLHDRPEMVAGRTVLDLGAGSGIVAIATAKCGAARVIAAEVDRYAVAALRLNAAANDVTLEVSDGDLISGPPPAVDVITVGDLFYDLGLAQRATGFLGRCAKAGVTVLIGDPYRAYLPRQRLRLLAEYRVADMGAAGGSTSTLSGVFEMPPQPPDVAT